jgi:hypothetical protein
METETAVEIGPDTTAQRQSCNQLPRQTRTRKGKARLLTIDGLDARTAAAKAARQLIDSLTADKGGDDQLSAGERQLVHRAALTGAIVADFEARWVAGEPIPLNEYLSAVNVQRRVLATLGLERRARPVVTIGDLWRADQEEQRRERERAANQREASQ